MSNQLKLAIIIGSTREDRFCPIPANWIAQQATEHSGFDVDLIDLIDADLPMHISNTEVPQVAAMARRIEAADAYIVVTPEYNHSFPGVLKVAIDHFMQEWTAKPVGLVSYGGMAGGQRAVEQLRQVFAELHAPTIRETLSFTNFWEKFDDNGQPIDLNGANAGAKGFLDQLQWWGVTLQEGRAKRPFHN